MTMTPEDVQATRFREGWRGYDEDEVDDFMSRVAHALQVVRAERDDAHARAERLAREAEATQEDERLLQRTLLTAERAAEETRTQAAAEAEQLLSEARAEAERIRLEAHDRAQREIARAAEVAEQMRRAIAEFRALRDAYAGRIEQLVAEQLAALERIGRIPDLPDELGAFERLAVDGADGGGPVDGNGAASAGVTPGSALDLDDLTAQPSDGATAQDQIAAAEAPLAPSADAEAFGQPSGGQPA